MRAAFLIVALFSFAVTAAPKSDPVAAANSAMAEADFDKALAVLDAALKKAGNKAPLVAKLHLMRGETLVALQRVDDATVAFSAALAADPTVSLDPATASPDAVTAMNSARGQIMSELSITVSNGTANIKLDDVELGPAPLKTRAGAGKHKVEAITPSGQTVSREIDIIPAVPFSVMLETPAAASPVASTPAIEVRKPVARTRSSGGSKLGLIPLAAGVAIAGGGAACLFLAKGKHDQLVDPKGPALNPTTEQQLVNDGGSFQTIGFALIGVGAAAAVAGSAMLVFMSGSNSVSLYAVPSEQGGLVGVSGTF